MNNKYLRLAASFLLWNLVMAIYVVIALFDFLVELTKRIGFAVWSAVSELYKHLRQGPSEVSSAVRGFFSK